jgi:polyhydroxyalkanoate synthesis regulator phasin
MILLGFKSITSFTGSSENDLGNVTHQRVDIIAGSPTDTNESLSKLYHEMVEKGEKDLEELGKLEDTLEYSNLTEDEYNRKSSELLSSIQILKYDRVIIVDGLILK